MQKPNPAPVSKPEKQKAKEGGWFSSAWSYLGYSTPKEKPKKALPPGYEIKEFPDSG
jgi:hypothetical protein